jgi:hypothetical protein
VALAATSDAQEVARLGLGGIQPGPSKGGVGMSATSTGAQNTNTQRQELEACAERVGHTVVRVYENAGISGAK